MIRTSMQHDMDDAMAEGRAITSIKLPYGLKNETLVHISDAQQGLACDCVCPACKQPLVARKGILKVHHFAHHRSVECAKAVETALHLASKQILMECREIAIPGVTIELTTRHWMLITGARTIPLEAVHEEHRTEDIVPDILAYSGGTPLMIEINVTHGVDEAKLAKIRRLGISAIEIDLFPPVICRTFSHDELLDAVVRQTYNKTWIHNVKADKFKRLLLRTGERKKTIRRGYALHVDDCPINARIRRGKSYANVIDDCLGCVFSLEIPNCDLGIPNYDIAYVLCGGKRKIRTLEELIAFYKKPKA